MTESVDAFMRELVGRYPVDERFQRNIRPLIERVFDESVSVDERRRLLRLVERTFRRQVENRDNLERAKDGIRRIFAGLYERILKDLGPQVDEFGREAASGSAGSAEHGRRTDDRHEPGSIEPGADDSEAWSDPDNSLKPLLPQDPIWSDDEDDEPAATHEAPSKRDVLFGEYLIRRGVLNPASLLGALEEQVREKPLLGWVGLRRGLLTEQQVLKVLCRQVREDRRFGEIAVEEGFLDDESVDLLRRVQKKYTPLLGKILATRGDLSQEAVSYFLEEFAAEQRS